MLVKIRYKFNHYQTNTKVKKYKRKRGNKDIHPYAP